MKRRFLSLLLFTMLAGALVAQPGDDPASNPSPDSPTPKSTPEAPNPEPVVDPAESEKPAKPDKPKSTWSQGRVLDEESEDRKSTDFELRYRVVRFEYCVEKFEERFSMGRENEPGIEIGLQAWAQGGSLDYWVSRYRLVSLTDDTGRDLTESGPRRHYTPVNQPHGDDRLFLVSKGGLPDPNAKKVILEARLEVPISSDPRTAIHVDVPLKVGTVLEKNGFSITLGNWEACEEEKYQGMHALKLLVAGEIHRLRSVEILNSLGESQVQVMQKHAAYTEDGVDYPPGIRVVLKDRLEQGTVIIEYFDKYEERVLEIKEEFTLPFAPK